MKILWRLSFLGLVVLASSGPALDAQQATTAVVPPPATEDRFEKQVLLYEAADKITPPRRGQILLAGDSQFFRWKTLAEDLPGYPIANRGIDSFQLSDLIRYADRLIVPHAPRLVVLHVGGNDIHNGKQPEQVLADFKQLVSAMRTRLKHVQIAFTSVTPSPGRWDEADRRRKTNEMIADYVRTQPDLLFIDLWQAMLTADGKPREDLWVEDRVHPNHAGYLLRVDIMRPLLDAAALREKR